MSARRGNSGKSARASRFKKGEPAPNYPGYLSRHDYVEEQRRRGDQRLSETKTWDMRERLIEQLKH